MIDAITRGTFSMLAGSGLLKKAASRYGLRRANSFARRFVAGENLEDAIAAAGALERQGLTVTLDLLGESVATMEPALAATQAYIGLVKAVTAAGISRNISVKLTQIGLDIDRASAIDNLRRILHVATAEDFFVRVDMENSDHTDDTLEAVESLWGIGAAPPPMCRS
jgi:proline dehydrogenase